jgi:FkbM family methyltransferase
MSLAAAKQLSISLGLYRPARALHSLIFRDPDRRDHLAILSEFIKPGDLAFDVGANIGDRSDLMLSLGAKVVAFEPQPMLVREVRARASAKRLTVVEAALGAQIGRADLFLTSLTRTASMHADWDGSSTGEHGKINVPMTTLDAEIRKHGLPVFCKMDIEGFEAEVLKGLSSPIRALSIEFHSDERGVAKMNQCVDMITQLAAYEFNLIGTEEAKWISPHWMSKAEFLSAFPACAHPHYYGDVFMRQLPRTRPPE